MTEQTSNRLHTLKTDHGMPQYYKFYCKTYNKQIDKQKFNDIITDFNLGVIDLILNDSLSYQIPHLYMEIMIRKDKRKPRIANGKLINNVPIDWKRTNELWNRDKEAKEKKLLVRYNNSHTSGYVFRVFLKKFKSNIKNKTLFKIKTNRKFQRMLKKRIMNDDKDRFDSFLLY